MRKHVIAKIELPGAEAYWQIDIEDHEDDFYMVGFEEYQGTERKICTEQLLDKEDLKDIADLINHVIGENQ